MLKNDIERTLQAHNPDPSEGFAEMIDDKVFHLMAERQEQKAARKKKRLRLVPVTAAALVVVMCVGMLAANGHFGLINRPDEIRPGEGRYTVQPIETVLAQGTVTVPGETDGTENPAVLVEENESDVIDRGYSFIQHWNGESIWDDADLEAMLDLCTPEWKEKAGDTIEALKEILGNTSYNGMQGYISLSGESGDPVRTMTMQGHGKWVQTKLSFDLKLEADGFRYIDPESVQITVPEEPKLHSLVEMKLEDLDAELKNHWPGITEELIPMNLSCESQGFRVEVISALVKGREAWFVCSVQDLKEEERDFDRDVFGYSFQVQTDITDQMEEVTGNTFGYDKEEHKQFFLAHQEYDEPITSKNRNITLNVKDIIIIGTRRTELTPLIEKYGKTVDGIEPPEMYPDERDTKKRNVLDYRNPLDIQIEKGVYLTGIGWIDDELHVQVRFTYSSRGGRFPVLFMNNLNAWGAEDYDPKFSGSMWTEESGQAENWQAEVWYEYFSPLKQEDVEYVRPALEIDTELETVEGDWNIQIPLDRLMVGGSQDDVESIGTDNPEETEAASGVESADINALLEQEWPGITEELVPVNLSCEKQGIRIDVLSALAKDKGAWIVYTLQDLEEDRTPRQDIYQYVPSVFTDFDHGAHYVASRYLLYDETTRKSFMAAYIQYYDTIQPDSRYVSIMINHINIIGETKTDLAPLIEQYGKTAEGTEPPELLYTSPVDLKKNVLDFHNPLDIPVDEDVTLTGIGWIDNELHVQLHMTDRIIRAFAAKSDAGNSYVDGIQYCETGFEEESWDEDGNGRGDWAEFISEVKPEEKDSVKAEIRIQKCIESVTDDWEIQIPLNQIMAGGSQETDESAENIPEQTAEAPEGTGSAYDTYDMENLHEKMESKWPEIREELIPVNLSCEKQGIRVELLSALVQDREAWVMYTVQDLDGDRISGRSMEQYRPYAVTVISQNLDMMSGTVFTEYDETTHKMTVAEYVLYDQPVEPYNGPVTFGIKNITISGHTDTDLTPLIGQYGKTAEGIEPPEMLFTEPTDLKRKVLDTHDPLDIQIDEGVVLTGIGVIDNELHIQLQYPDNRLIWFADNTRYHKMIMSYVSYSFENREHDINEHFMSACWDENGDGVEDREEYISRLKQEDADKAVTILCVERILESIEDNWEIQIPLCSVRKEGNRFEYDGLVFGVKEDNSLTVVSDPSYKQSTKIVIPETVYGLYVREIAEDAFKDCTNLTSVIMLDYVTEIGDYAFSGCENLASLILPKKLETVGEGAFEGCKALTSIDLPDNVMTIGGSAFRGCSSLKSVSIPYGAKFEGGHVFADCTSLVSVTLPGCMENLEIYTFSGCENLEWVIIREGTRTIGRGAFRNCEKLKLVEIPYSVYYISDYAFENCGNLEKIELPEIVSYIGKNAFTGCENLVCVVYEGSYAQQYCEENGIQYEIRQAE
ncbi:leucine-rich repeat domain-containing protein [Aristaeella lactis]|uniref:Leucine rich repeat-containing protein n=1 Tax=Aristaeella lactis TaxID=3046383 RepID=A0AC61PKL9_9FIRM|nr:leucine-rich repeat domain-containing protein [Aristaeella lactis]QUA52000.1 leucine-rich repeat domain-containing protein [Aristaeella lactis]SMC54711.1 Leucine rich repeat-containing protein [Aristaeella lactis]